MQYMQLKLIIVSIIKRTICSCSMVSISKLPLLYSKKKIMLKATIAENLCQALGTGLYLDVQNDSPSRGITLL
jgi:hypothetical protein